MVLFLFIIMLLDVGPEAGKEKVKPLQDRYLLVFWLPFCS